MGFVCKTKFEKFWIAVSLSLFVAHRLMENSSPGYYSDAAPFKMWLELAMIALSFPLGGFALFALHSALFWCDDCGSLGFLFDWSTLLFAGYIQWFWVLPEFLRTRELTLLDLRRLPEAIATATSTAAPPALAPPAVAPASPAVALAPPALAPVPPAPVAAPPALVAAPLSNTVPDFRADTTPGALAAAPRDVSAHTPPAVFDPAAYAPRFAEFDEAGLTALDKVFQPQPPKAAHASPSHVEAIFPRVG